MSQQSVSEGGVAAPHPERSARQLLVAPATEKQANAVRPGLFPIACFKLEDIRFDFDSSVLLPDVQTEMPLLKGLIDAHMGDGAAAGPKDKPPPLSIFGHTDPEGSDDYNKGLGGRRAAAVYGLLTRRAEIWEDLYSGTGKFAPKIAGDQWGTRSIQLMLNGLPPDPAAQPPGAAAQPPGTTAPVPLEVDGQPGPMTQAAIKRFQTNKGLAASGNADADTRKALFLAYMDVLCVDGNGKPYQIDPTDGFLGHNDSASDGKADFQGCGEFNPLMLFSQSALQAYDAAADHTERDQLNRVNRRVMALLFRPGAQVSNDSWPCPKAKEGAAGCRLRFWSDGDKRRKNTDKERWFKDTQDTFACRFYQRISHQSPCEAVVPRNVDRCKMVPVNGTLKISAKELAPDADGPYSWTTDSTQITLQNADTDTVTIQAGADPSFNLGDETVTLTCAGGAQSTVKTVGVTVIELVFAGSPNQLYGFDDFDMPQNSFNHHVCVKSGDHTFVKVDIQGGALGTDFTFVMDDPGVCKVSSPVAETSFDLRLDAATISKKKDTVLTVRLKCPKAPQVVARLQVHVYEQRVVNVSVAKIDNPTTTFLRFATADYAAHAAVANKKLKEGVVKYNISNFSSDNSITPVTYTSGTGELSFDINASDSGPDLVAIGKAFAPVPAGTVRVAIIRSMKSFYYLQSAASKGATSFTVRGSGCFYKKNDSATMGTGDTAEAITITADASGTTVSCSALANDHAAGEQVDFPAAGWSTDPILIMEGDSDLIVAKWTVLHEVGHRTDFGLALADIDDRADFMNYMQDWYDYRLRYSPRTKHYAPAAGTGKTENQWELIPRP